MKTIYDIQNVIVAERNNFGDYTVCGDDLLLAAAAAILIYAASDKGDQEKLVSLAEDYREALIGECPSLGIEEK